MYRSSNPSVKSFSRINNKNTVEDKKSDVQLSFNLLDAATLLTVVSALTYISTYFYQVAYFEYYRVNTTFITVDLNNILTFCRSIVPICTGIVCACLIENFLPAFIKNYAPVDAIGRSVIVISGFAGFCLTGSIWKSLSILSLSAISFFTIILAILGAILFNSVDEKYGSEQESAKVNNLLTKNRLAFSIVIYIISIPGLSYYLGSYEAARCVEFTTIKKGAFFVFGQFNEKYVCKKINANNKLETGTYLFKPDPDTLVEFDNIIVER